MSKLMEEDEMDFSRGPEIAQCFRWKKLAELTAAPGNILKQLQQMEKTTPISRLSGSCICAKITGLTIH